ncbi:hypothetical protein VII00023_10549 [Vibrio ichthyoenteri ATCC 700023]|uniref:Uncharacterized protein n=1 Tax=Vibrio ichthyoenteri ATCC 700023 TaxID=870968 RepID=F9S304_9VIBR|nr:hypothetical protein [Vibrio ichthyoenteri]EGU38563.1 hypothetical protein VII00023_10549 [Vibrio ichthyoenteri ATCC 700023]
MLTDMVVVLGKSWVASRRPMGKGALVMCEFPLQLNELVKQEIGDAPIFIINTVLNGQRKVMKAIRVNRDTVCWEESCRASF